MNNLGAWLSRLGGANPAVLVKAEKERTRFIALGLVLLATASLAVISMTFAMIDGLHVVVGFALVIGLLWGGVILIVDRALVLNLKRKGSAWRLLAMIAPRILMAGLLGLVIATPLTLRVFAPEIALQVAQDNAGKAEATTGQLDNGSQQDQLTKLNEKIKGYEDALNGNVQYTSPTLLQAQSEYDAAQKDYNGKEDVATVAYRKWRCELDGEQCDGGSGKVGQGARADADKKDYDAKQKAADAANIIMLAKQSALQQAQDQNKQDTSDKLKQAQQEANRVLPDLRAQRDKLQRNISGQVGAIDDQAAKDDGLLAKLVALDHLGQQDGWARAAHLVVAGLLFMIELLPVTVKTLTVLGPPTLYDMVDELDDKQVVEEAVQSRGLDRRRRRRYDQKANEIDDDMFSREIDIAKDMNAKVSDIVRQLAAEQVDDWGKKVQSGLLTYKVSGQNGSNGSNGGGQQNGQSHNGNGVPQQRKPARSALRAIADKLNLPQSRKHLS